LSVGSFAGPTHADGAPSQDAPQGLVLARLVAENTSLQQNRSGWLAVLLRMKPGWHTYWRNPGDAGLATGIKWTLPQGVTAGPIIWPRPKRFVARSIVGYGYEEQVALLAAVKLPARFAADTINIGADVSWLACSNVCIPGSKTLKLTLSVSDSVPRTNPAQERLFAEARRRIPQPAPFDTSFVMDQEQIRLSVPRVALSGVGRLSAEFYPFDSGLIEHAASQTVSLDKQGFELILQRGPVATDEIGVLEGLLILEESAAGTVKSRAFDVFARRATSPGDSLPAR
jgi:DsbC/DsbD-like thiol-disulfide interchange protein